MSVLWKLQLQHCSGSRSVGPHHLVLWHGVDQTYASKDFVVLVSMHLGQASALHIFPL